MSRSGVKGAEHRIPASDNAPLNATAAAAPLPVRLQAPCSVIVHKLDH